MLKDTHPSLQGFDGRMLIAEAMNSSSTDRHRALPKADAAQSGGVNDAKGFLPGCDDYCSAETLRDVRAAPKGRRWARSRAF